MPCIPELIRDRPTWPCNRFELMSQEDAEKEADEDLAVMERNGKARIAAKDDAKAKGLGQGNGIRLHPVPGLRRRHSQVLGSLG